MDDDKSICFSLSRFCGSLVSARTGFGGTAMKWTLLAVVAFYSLGGCTCFAAENGEGCVVESDMLIRSLGTDIGTVSARIAGTSTDSDLKADVDVNIGWWLFSFALKSSESATIRGGKMVAYWKTIDTGGHHKEITGELKGAIFTILVRDQGETERKEFPAKSYQVTNMEYPEVTLAPGEVRKMRVVDLENAEIVDREYRHVTEEQMMISGRCIRVVVSDASDKNSEYRRWTAIIKGVPVVIRQEGKEKTGLFNPAYSVRYTRVAIRLNEITHKPPAQQSSSVGLGGSCAELGESIEAKNFQVKK
jgi:hypothetical protein